MPGKVGTPTIYKTIIPGFDTLCRVYDKKLSKEAKQRLRVIDFYYHKASQNVSLTARHFGVSRSYIYKWIKRLRNGRLCCLENHSKRPKHTRSVQYSYKTVEIIRKIRTEYPSYSAIKVSILLLRDYGIRISSSTVGRIIKRFNMFFSKVVQRSEVLSRKAKKAWQKRKDIERIKYRLQTDKPHHIIEFDMKHINNNGIRQYALCAIDIVTKEPIIHIASTCTAAQAKIALEKTLKYFGKDILIVTDNGSENFSIAKDYLKECGVKQLFTRPHTPKDKPRIENFIGKYQKECLDESLDRCQSVEERQEEADKWVRDWIYYRPNQALGYKTPAEFCATMGITI